ncbi:MAG: class I SAM-dependent RNA methyltransferase [bacterium]|nr:class I SAM-dependent RNA methyltransferase [bacterium]
MEYKVTITALDYHGRGIARINNQVIFIDNVWIGDEVIVDIIDKKKNYLVGKIKKYYLKDAKCKYYHECGSCNLLHMDYSHQLDYKKNMLQELLKRNCDIDITVSVIKCDNPFNYRNKVVLHVKEGVIGYYQKRSNDLVAIEQCLLVSSGINRLIKELKELDLTKVTRIMIRELDNNLMLVIDGKLLLNNIILDMCNSIIINNKVIKGKDYLMVNINDLLFKVSYKSFFQVNTLQMIKLYDCIKEYAGKGKKLIDLYCGISTIGIYLHNNFENILGIEINDSCIKDALINKNINQIDNISFINSDVSKINIKENADVVIIDPPRSGLDNRSVALIERIYPSKIIYVSCNPITFVRDIKLFTKYKLENISMCDMFCQTNHVESVALLQRKNQSK